ncbi:hypothetical protein EV127DRAFT_454294 [Xylaria flabelliformis]|nr:hypothetical protein EV127DRAFT_454294 [Xylaria flabelliformis]
MLTHLVVQSRREIHPGVNIETQAPDVGTVLPPGYHLEEELGADGSDIVFNAPRPFARRMWAGGRMRWTSGEFALRVGDKVEERTRLVGATPKRSRMVLVQVEKEFWGPRGLELLEGPEATTPSPAAEKVLHDAGIRGPSTVKDVSQDGAYPQRRRRWSPTGLFRFSALTFNGHKIHYDPTWSAAVEGHPTSVVHGPLNLISMLDYWRDHCAAGKHIVQEIRYRAVSPVYAGETYEISAGEAQKVVGEDGGLSWDIVVSKVGKTCMTGSILGV